MSFGASPSDIIILVTFCKTLYRKCKEAGGEYLEISREVRGLHTVLRHLKYEVEAPESVLNRDRSTYGRELAPIIGDCDYTLCMLDELLQKYGRLGDTSPSSPRVLWDKIRFGSNEMDELGGIRVKLISHKTSLTLFLDTIQLHQSGKVEKTLDLQNGQLDKILDKVDGIASRMGHRAGSVMTSYDDDDKEVWKQFRRELVAEGFDSAVLHKHKDVLRAYIREIDQDGLLDDIPREIHNHPSPGVNPERWLDHVHSETSDDPPPSFRTFETNTTDDSTKELAAREDNMKFPQSIKAERGKTQSMKVGHDVQNKLNVPNWNLPKGRTGSDESQRHLSPVPKLITSSEKEPLYQNTSGSESDDSDSGASENKKSQFGSSELALVIRTSDLTSDPSNMALQVRPSGSPSSYRSQASFTSFTDEEVPRSMVFRPKSSLDYESSPPHNGALSIPQSQKIQDGRSSPRQTPIRLAPDQNGNEIPADAKWTRIKRSLVSPEVLAQDRRRYEARPEFVAVLGVLTREEIQGYAARSYALREARHREHQKRQNPAYLPRPSPIPIPRSPENNRQSRYTPSEDSSDSADEDRHQRPRYTEHRTYLGSPTPSYTHVHQSGYPNPYGVRPPPSPALSSSSNLTPQSARLPQHSPRESHSHHHSSHREKERRESRRRHSSPSRQPSQTKVAEKEKNKSRWKENLSAGAVGGAAFSLLHVLTEAAEGL